MSDPGNSSELMRVLRSRHVLFWACSIMEEDTLFINPLTPFGDQDRISPYTTNTISSRQVMRIKKISIRGWLVDPVPNSLN